MKNISVKVINIFASIFFFPLYFFSGLFLYFFNRKSKKRRLVWGSTPILNNKYWSSAMKKAGFYSDTYVTKPYSVNKNSDWDKLLVTKYKIPPTLGRYFAFLESLFLYDIFFISFEGFFIGDTPLKKFQSFFFRLARKKVVVLPYGADASVYRNIRSTSAAHGFNISYPEAARKQNIIFKQVEYWTKNADAIIPAGMFPDGIGRWDVFLPSSISLDLDIWMQSRKKQKSNGLSEEVVIAHAPNHRGFKGTEFIIDAIQKLKNKGLKIKFLLIEGKSNSEVQRVFREEVDILLDQLIFPAYGLNSIEGMASGLTTICNLEDQNYIYPLRRWSYLCECPIVSATPENIEKILEKLISNPELRATLGKCGRDYVLKYHGLDSAIYLFKNIIEYIYGEKESIIDLYHPLKSDYKKNSPKIKPPLKRNKLIF